MNAPFNPQQKPRLADLAWTQTQSGRAVSLLDPNEDDIHWHDVAVALGNISRFNGQTPAPSFLSVAMHCVIVSDAMADHGHQARLYGLLHDAHEAYTGDLTSPTKIALTLHIAQQMQLHARPSQLSTQEIASRALRNFERPLIVAIHKRAGLPWPPPERIKRALSHADRAALRTERDQHLAPPPAAWAPGVEGVDPLPRAIPSMPPAAAACAWLDRASELLPSSAW